MKNFFLKYKYKMKSKNTAQGPNLLAEVRRAAHPDGPTLVEYPIHKSIGWTISLPDKFKIPVSQIFPKPRSGRVKRLHWDMMTPEQQWNYIVHIYVPDIFKTCNITKYHMYPELNDRKNIHAHAVIYSEDPKYDVIVFQKICSQHANCTKIHCGKFQHRLNFIHTLTDKPGHQWIDYIQKDKSIPLNPVNS